MKLYLFVILCFGGMGVFAQSWMPGYEFRKKITFDKTKIEGDFIGSAPKVELDVPDFPVLVELQDEAFKYRTVSSCDGIVYDVMGRNVAFATAAAPGVKLSFQIESYDPVLGKYRCWVKIPLLAAMKTTTPATEIYFYYGGSALHDSYSTAGLNTWNNEYTAVWHMNGENSDLGSINVRSAIAAEHLMAHGMNDAGVVTGKIGNAMELNGTDQYLRTAGNTNNAFTITAWVKWNGGSSIQMIATNDSIGSARMGWQFQIRPDGKFEIVTYRSASLFYTSTASLAITPGVWNHVVCSYSITGTNSSLVIIINGASAGSAGGAGLRLSSPGGYFSVGRNKGGSQYFNGAIDELRLYNVAKPIYWIRNEYRNQIDPSSFYSVGIEEYSPSWATFTGAANTNWATTANWLNSVKPVAGGKLRISAGKTTKVTGADIAFGQLVLEAGAVLSSAVNLQLNCNVKLGAGASLMMDIGKKLTLAGNGLNLSGAGTVHTEELEVNAGSASSEVFLDAEIKISKSLKLSRGLLNANGKLTLLSSSQSNTAVLLPIADGNVASVTGDVNVQSFIDGSFPEPSSGRGWRLLSSPVMHGGLYAYHLKDFKAHIFVTGSGGAANGFDDSPKNGATIYTHDQSLPGMLSQKYLAVANMQAAVPLGRGVYVYSRGSRFVPDAFRDQIMVQPFSNPAPYVLTYKGKLFVGDLNVQVFNRNTGGEGDGFNLLGNPYASPIKWGALDKVNVGPFVWLFDPLNGTYVVSDDPDMVIPAGSGFFVKVMNGFTSGSVKFNEQAKVMR